MRIPGPQVVLPSPLLRILWTFGWIVPLLDIIVEIRTFVWIPMGIAPILWSRVVAAVKTLSRPMSPRLLEHMLGVRITLWSLRVWVPIIFWREACWSLRVWRAPFCMFLPWVLSSLPHSLSFPFFSFLFLSFPFFFFYFLSSSPTNWGKWPGNRIQRFELKLGCGISVKDRKIGFRNTLCFKLTLSESWTR